MQRSGVIRSQLRIPKELDEQLSKIAHENDRSKNAQLNWIIKDWIKNEESKKH